MTVPVVLTCGVSYGWLQRTGAITKLNQRTVWEVLGVLKEKKLIQQAEKGAPYILV